MLLFSCQIVVLHLTLASIKPDSKPVPVVIDRKNPHEWRGSSRMPKPLNEPKDKSGAKRGLKTSCIFCHETADAETPYSSSIHP